MVSYTYDEFEKALNESGLAGTFSDADLRLAKSNPNVGMSLLNNKISYNKATTDEQRALLNAENEKLRQTYGSYTGGEDGSGYNFKEMTPSSFTPSTEAPVYESKYDDEIHGLINDIAERGEFSYDPEKDPTYSSYKKAYAREGQRAAEDVMGSFAGMTGGRPSSYAVTAAQQAGNKYAGEMADKIPELYKDAYARHQNDINMDFAKLDMYRDLEGVDYGRHLDDLENHRSQVNFEYGQYLDELEAKRIKEETERQAANDEFNKNVTINDIAVSAGDYSHFGELGITPNEALLNYGINSDIAKTEYERAYQIAVKMAAMGDYSLLRQLEADVKAGKYSVAPVSAASTYVGALPETDTGSDAVTEGQGEDSAPEETPLAKGVPDNAVRGLDISDVGAVGGAPVKNEDGSIRYMTVDEYNRALNLGQIEVNEYGTFYASSLNHIYKLMPDGTMRESSIIYVGKRNRRNNGGGVTNPDTRTVTNPVLDNIYSSGGKADKDGNTSGSKADKDGNTSDSKADKDGNTSDSKGDKGIKGGSVTSAENNGVPYDYVPSAEAEALKNDFYMVPLAMPTVQDKIKAIKNSSLNEMDQRWLLAQIGVAAD